MQFGIVTIFQYFPIKFSSLEIQQHDNWVFYPSRIQLLRPNDVTQKEVLAGAISELLWKVENNNSAPSFVTMSSLFLLFELIISAISDGKMTKCTHRVGKI